MTEWSSQLVLIIVPLLPLLLVLGLTIPALRHPLERLAPLAAIPGLLLALTPQAGAPVTISWLFLGAHLGLDATGRTFLLLTALLWLAAGLYAHSYCRKYPNYRRFWIFFLATMSGNLGLTLSLDMVSFYVFFTLMSFAAYGLIVHEGTSFTLRAGKIYLWLVIIGEVLLFAALVLAARIADSLLMKDVAAVLADTSAQPLIIGLLMIALGIKMGIVPLHFWLPLAHPAAPVPASAVLSGAMIKAGLLGLLRLLPLGHVALPGWSMALISLGLLMAFLGVAAGLFQTQSKTLLAYSSISQMGFPLLGIGLGLAHPATWPLVAGAISFYALHHGLAKGALFLGVGMILNLKGTPVLRLATLAGVLIPALALAGAPWTSGALAKSGLKEYLFQSPLAEVQTLVVLLGLAATGTTLLMCRLVFLLFKESEQSTSASAMGMWTGWLLLIIVVTMGGIRPVWLTGIRPEQIPKLVDAAWPLLLAALIATAVWYKRPPFSRNWNVPAGDMIVIIEGMAKRLADAVAMRPRPALPQLPRQPRWQNLPMLLLLWDAEKLLRQLTVAGVMFILLLLVLLLL